MKINKEDEIIERIFYANMAKELYCNAINSLEKNERKIGRPLIAFYLRYFYGIAEYRIVLQDELEKEILRSK